MADALNAILAALMSETPDVEVRGSEYERNGVVFAAQPDPASVELRLGSEIAEAALRTSDTHSSSRGDDWVLLNPRDWGSTRDRLDAWYRVAWRLAGKQRR